MATRRECGRKIGQRHQCRWIEAETKSGRSAAVLGLRQWAEVDGGTPPLVLRTGPGPAKGLAGKLGNFDLSDPVLRERAALAVVLFLALLVLPYAQAFLLKPFVAHKVAVIQSHQDRLTTIDHELNFLQYLKQNSPPYLDTLYLFAQAAPPGTSFDSLTMNEHGEVSMSGSMGGFQQVAEFRAKLIQSGFFSNVSVQEQAPAQFPQKVNVRMTAQWKPATARAQLKIGPTADEIAQVGKEPRTSGNGAAGIGPRPAHAARQLRKTIRTLTHAQFDPTRQRTIRYGGIFIGVYLLLFSAFHVWKMLEQKRSDYKDLVAAGAHPQERDRGLSDPGPGCSEADE